MKYHNNAVTDVKIAYIGGGSRGWAWGLMSDLAACPDMSGRVDLYDIDAQAALDNQLIGNRFNDLPDARGHWDYTASPTLAQALKDADFVFISIMPGTFDEMESDVHAPEQYGIYQPVGDSSGPGGIVRALRTLPMMEEIALGVKEHCPQAWVINYTNPMTLCVAQLYKSFPHIKAFGCCHEVFGTQNFLKQILQDTCGFTGVSRSDIKVNVTGVNHFTWLTTAHYGNIDLYPIYRDYCKEHACHGTNKQVDTNWANAPFVSHEMVKMDLFQRTGVIAAAGDRHLAEFCPGNWYLSSPERVREMGFALTSVAWRKDNLKDRLARAQRLITGEEPVVIRGTGEEGVEQMRALCGLKDFVTNVNLPNRGQVANLPLGAVVETNAHFSCDRVAPVLSGEIPPTVHPLVSPISAIQTLVLEAVARRDLKMAFAAFCADPLVSCSLKDAWTLFCQMVKNTARYLDSYDLTNLDF